MQKINIKFIFDIIDSHIQGYEENFGTEFALESKYSIQALEKLKKTLKTFIDEVNKL